MCYRSEDDDDMALGLYDESEPPPRGNGGCLWWLVVLAILHILFRTGK